MHLRKIELRYVPLEATPEWYDGQPLSEQGDQAALAVSQIIDRPQETVLVVGLDPHFYPLGLREVSIGTVDRALATARDVFQGLILLNATHFFIAHNHPVGAEIEPSREDIHMTRTLADAGQLLNIRLVDSLIVGGDGSWLSILDWMDQRKFERVPKRATPRATPAPADEQVEELEAGRAAQQLQDLHRGYKDVARQLAHAQSLTAQQVTAGAEGMFARAFKPLQPETQQLKSQGLGEQRRYREFLAAATERLLSSQAVAILNTWNTASYPRKASK